MTLKLRHNYILAVKEWSKLCHTFGHLKIDIK
jgi:hypothetical protein